MNIQIFGTKKCFDTKKAQRFFKERGIRFQFIDLKEKELSKGEFQSVKNAVGGLDQMVDEKCKDQATYQLIQYLSSEDKEEKVLTNQQVLRTPIVRNGKKATIGYQPDVWRLGIGGEKMKSVLCYGDSNTYGFNPMTGLRYPKNIRWTGRLQQLLGEDYEIIEEGCNGRTTIFRDPVDAWKTGADYLTPCLNSHKPVDIVVLMLGSNDLKTCYHKTAREIAQGAASLVEMIMEFSEYKHVKKPEVILMAPPLIGPDIMQSSFSGGFDPSAINRSMEFAKEYEEEAKRLQCHFLNAAAFCIASKKDSLHLMPEEHEKLADAVAEMIAIIE